jgi:hypothetical protein
MLAVYGLGALCVFAYILRKTAVNGRDKPKNMARFGLMYAQYLPEFHAWELVVMLKRTGAVLIGAAARPNLSGVQLTGFTFLQFLYLMAVLYYQPFLLHRTFVFAVAATACQFTFSFAGV